MAAAAGAVANAVVAEFADALEDIEGEYISDFGPEAAAAISGVFEHAETNALVLSPAQYAKIVPTNALGLDPQSEGAFGIGHIYKSSETGDIVALTRDAIAGAICTPAILENHPGDCDIRLIGEVGKFPMILKTKWDGWNECVKCSVECLAGFAIVNSTGVKRYTVGEAPTPSNYENGPEDKGEED